MVADVTVFRQRRRKQLASFMGSLLEEMAKAENTKVEGSESSTSSVVLGEYIEKRERRSWRGWLGMHTWNRMMLELHCCTKAICVPTYNFEKNINPNKNLRGPLKPNCGGRITSSGQRSGRPSKVPMNQKRKKNLYYRTAALAHYCTHHHQGK